MTNRVNDYIKKALENQTTAKERAVLTLGDDASVVLFNGDFICRSDLQNGLQHPYRGLIVLFAFRDVLPH